MRRTFAITPASVPLRIGLIAAVAAAALLPRVALSQEAGVEDQPPTLTTEPLGMTGWRHDAIDITTDMLGMTGWRPDRAVTITTGRLGMTGWKRDPVTITTWALGMTGWQSDPIVVTTPELGMAGWRHDPIIVTTPAFRMTGWAEGPEQCTPPFLPDDAGQGCICPPELLPASGTCIAPSAAAAYDLRVELEGPNACEVGKRCSFDVFVANVGDGPFRGPLVVQDTIDLETARFSATGAGWACSGGACIQPQVTLAPGASARLTVAISLPAGDGPGRLSHCANLQPPEPGDTPVRFVQLMLPAAGIDAGPPDNQIGQKTRAGIAAFRSTVGLPPGAEIDPALIAALSDLVPADPHPENDRSCASVRINR